MKFDILAQVLAWVILAARGCLRVTLTIPPFGFDEYEMNDVRSGKKKKKRKKRRSQRHPVREAVEFGGSLNLLHTACCSAPPCDCPLGGAGARSHAPTHVASRAQFRSRRYELFGEE